MSGALHVTNGDCAAELMREAGIDGEILSWRDVLHDGPVPRDLSLAELSHVRAAYLASAGAEEFSDLAQSFVDRDTLFERFAEFERVVLWFEWDLYDQLQLIQVLHTIGHRAASLGTAKLPPIEHVSFAGYLGNLLVERFPVLLEERKPVMPEMLSLGQAAWRAFTSPDPTDIVALLEVGTADLQFLEGAMWRLLEELPSTRNGLSRSEQQLLEGLSEGNSRFEETFRYAGEREERIYCGDSSAASYIERLSRGATPLVVYPSGERVTAPQTEAQARQFRDAELVLTDAARGVLAGKQDWIELGGTDRWLGGVHLDGSNARWRWDGDSRRVIESAGA
ncbi:MAG TPA: DUF1835 domain-containing protein [Gemmatimonadaceae bacterium]|nr:DUF1835 domain-containing protein [Gemmatimonadaceae bacterium]